MATGSKDSDCENFEVILTPSSGSESHSESALVEASNSDQPLPDDQDDLTFGLGLVMDRLDGEEIQESHSGLGTTIKHWRCSGWIFDTATQRLDSEICAVHVGRPKVTFQAHREILEQSPIFAVLLEHKGRMKQALQVRLLNQDPNVFRRILQYLYSQRLFVPASEREEHINELMYAYILACKLKLDELQSLIIRTIEENEGGDTTKQVLRAAGLVYQADEARIRFGRFFVSTLEKAITKNGLRGPNGIGEVVDLLIIRGGLIAKDIAEAFRNVYRPVRKDDGHNERVEAQLQEANGMIEELEHEIAALKSRLW